MERNPPHRRQYQALPDLPEIFVENLVLTYHRSLKVAEKTLRHAGLIDGGVSLQSSSFESSPPVTASGKVFNTTELMEEMLLHLPLRAIVQAQRVNKLFRAAIKGSGRIQRAIFFAPAEKNTITHEYAWNEDEYRKRSMILSMVFDPTDAFVRVRDVARKDMGYVVSSNGTWKNNLISRPRCTHVWYAGAIDGEMNAVVNMEGVTMGDVFDVVKQHKRMPALERTRTPDPGWKIGLVRELSSDVTGWDVWILFQEILKEF